MVRLLLCPDILRRHPGSESQGLHPLSWRDHVDPGGQLHPHESPLLSSFAVTIGQTLYVLTQTCSHKILMRENPTATHHQRAFLTLFIEGCLQKPGEASVIRLRLCLSWNGSKVGFELEGSPTICTGRWWEVQVPETSNT